MPSDDQGPAPRTTADEFERTYAERSGITVEQLRSYGRIVQACDCGHETCQGWASVRDPEADPNVW